MNRKPVIKVAPRPAVIRERYADFLADLGKYLNRTKTRLDSRIRKDFVR